ncbi:hypothetical protein J437_LFUL008551 [Ladona fulva]|uniref:Uncharacterized protein n=1 Tax=Ladona fulva TaxID=123851 RepID=A0A8K0K914_LADFU|nr:hypothetical protein J437_LFUL008551 [Ladona fulva]
MWNYGEVWANIRIGQTVCSLKAQVVDSLGHYAGIVGLDFLREYGAVIDLRRAELRLGKDVVPLGEGGHGRWAPELTAAAPPDDGGKARHTQIILINDLVTIAKEHATTSSPTTTLKFISLHQEILKLITLRNRIRRQYHTYHNPYDSYLLKRLNNQIKKQISSFKSKKWHEFVSTLKFENNSLWKISKTLRKNPNISQPMLINSLLNNNPCDKANFAADYFSKALANNFPLQPSDIQINIIYNLISVTPSEDPPLSTNNKEVADILHSLNITKAPGPDPFSNKILKILANSPHFVSLLTNLLFCSQKPRKILFSLTTIGQSLCYHHCLRSLRK